MAIKTLKKTFVFTNEQSKKLIEGMINDEAEVKNTNFSFLFESHVLTNLLTSNRQVNFWIQCLYSDKYSVGDIMGIIFEFNSAGVCFESQHLPLFEMIEYLKYLDSITRKQEFDYDEIPEILYCIDSLKGYCEWKVENDDPNKRRYKEALMCIEPIIKDLKRNKPIIRTNDFYVIIYTFWDQLKDSTHTFRTLSHYCFLQKNWEITAELRLEFVNILRNLAENWPKEEE